MQTYDVPIQHERVRLKTNCGVPPLDREDSRLCMMGLNANTVVPERRHDRRPEVHRPALRRATVARAEDLRGRPFPSRLGMQMSLARETAKTVRRIEKTKQLA